MDIAALGSVAQVVEAATVLGATLFAVVQLSELKMQRRDAMVSELMRAFLDVHFAEAMSVIQRLPDEVLAGNLRDASPEAQKAFVLINTTFETMGLLVFRRIAPLGLVVELAGGVSVVLWHKLRPWLEQIRQEQGQPSWAEWFQWLAEQCAKRKDEGMPAYRLHADWNP